MTGFINTAFEYIIELESENESNGFLLCAINFASGVLNIHLVERLGTFQPGGTQQRLNLEYYSLECWRGGGGGGLGERTTEKRKWRREKFYLIWNSLLLVALLYSESFNLLIGVI